MVSDLMRVRKGEPRSQSALEFLTTYSFVFLIIAVVIALLLMFSSIPKSTLPFSCNFYSGFQCLDASLSVNSSGSPVLLIEASDTEPGTVNISSFSAFLNFYNSKSGYCVPNVAQAGEVVYCVANLTGSATLGSVYSGTIKITANYCAPGPVNITANCAKGSTYTYTGNIRVQATKFVLSNSYYLPVNITNNQSYAAPAHFQQMIQFLPHNYTVAESPDLGNIRFYYGGKELYSWCESNCSSSSAGVATFWVRTPQAIPPGQNMQIYMYFLPKSVQYDGVYAGEAPQLSPTYGEYDNGANVFNNYWNFAGTALPSGFSSLASGGTYSVNNGLTLSVPATAYDWIHVFTTSQYTPAIIESYVSSQTSLGARGEYDLAYTTVEPASSGTGSGFQTDYRFDDWNNNSRIAYDDAGASGVIIQSVFTLPTAFIISGSWPATGNEILKLNYANQLSATNTSITYADANLDIFISHGTTTAMSATTQWLRTRAYPPNGVMPHAKFGTLTPE